MKAILVSVQVGTPRFLGTDVGLPEPLDHRWRSAFFKEPVAGPVMLHSTNLAGDRQADPRVHGGPEMAVLAYSADHYPAWRAELGIAEMGPGGFAENFTISGQDGIVEGPLVLHHLGDQSDMGEVYAALRQHDNVLVTAD